MNNESTINLSGQTFRLSRFKAYFSAFYFANSRKLMLAGASCLVAWLLISLLPNLLSEFEIYADFANQVANHREYINPFEDPYWSVQYIAGGIFLTILATVAGSNMFSCMHGKGNRQTLLAIPASSLEKYLTYFIVYIVGSILVFFVSEIIADAVRVGVVKLFSKYGEYAHTMSLKSMLTFNLSVQGLRDGAHETYNILIIAFYTNIFCLAGLFSLGSILWQKASYLKTICSLWLLQTVLGTIAVLSMNVFFGFNSSVDLANFVKDMSPEAQNVYASAISAVFVIFIFWLGYRRFKDTDLVERW